MAGYRMRYADAMLRRKLEGKGAVLIDGPKWCGKTTTGEQQANSVIYMDEPKTRRQNLEMSVIDPQALLDGAVPRLIDEWQLAPRLWDAVRYEVDHRDGLGQFILTGSAVPVQSDEITHSGTGRIARVTMRPMSLFESGDSTGDVSLGGLFDRPDRIAGRSDMDIERLAFVTCRGGWPGALGLRDEVALDQAVDYCDAVAESDISRADGTYKNPERVKRLMRSFARNIGSQCANTVIARDMAANEEMSAAEETVAAYIAALKRIFVVEDMPAWNPNLRSKTAIRTADTRYYVDPSIAAAALGHGPRDLVSDLKTFGFLFEALCVRDLRVYADTLDGTVYHFRDKNGLECDAALHLRNGRYGLIEVKLGGDIYIDEAAHSLHAVAAKLDTDRMGEPSFLMVLVGLSDYAYRRQDGVYVVPAGCLRA